MAEKVGKRTIIVVEDLDDMLLALELGSKLGLEPRLGIRVKLYSRGSGKWEDSSGEFAKFGMSTVALVNALQALRQQGKTSLLKMLHFHIGSQINNIKRAKQASKRRHGSTRKFVRWVLTSNTSTSAAAWVLTTTAARRASEFSMNYSVQEFANDVIYVVGEVCDNEEVPAPIIVTESGRPWSPITPRWSPM